MIILLKMRNLALFALTVLSLSFIYIGYTGFGSDRQVAEKSQDNLPIVEEITVENFQNENTDMTNLENAEIESVLSLPGADEIDSIKNSNDYFVNFRLERERKISSQIEILQETINNPNSSPEVRKKAQEELLDISEKMTLEVQAENLLKAKGYEETAVIIQGDKTTVVINKRDLENKDVTKIGDLVVRSTGCSLEEIAIIPLNEKLSEK